MDLDFRLVSVASGLAPANSQALMYRADVGPLDVVVSTWTGRKWLLEVSQGTSTGLVKHFVGYFASDTEAFSAAHKVLRELISEQIAFWTDLDSLVDPED